MSDQSIQWEETFLRFWRQNEELCCSLRNYDIVLLSGMLGTSVSEKHVPSIFTVPFCQTITVQKTAPKLFFVSDFCRDAFEVFLFSGEALRGAGWQMITDVSRQPETSVTKCHPLPCNVPEERSLQSRITLTF
jgi:hypothetical protein